MSSRRSVRRALVALLVGVLVGGGLMAVTPAGAQVSSAVATNWKKIWKKNLKPLADKRYYTKAQSDAKYQPKGSYETAGSGYTKAETYSKAESDAKYSAAGSGYTKAEADAKYAAKPTVVRGVFSVRQTSVAGGLMSSPIAFGVTLSAAPTPHLIDVGDPVPADCSGTSTAPGAAPGHLCVFVTTNTNGGSPFINSAAGVPGASPFGAYIGSSAPVAGGSFLYGSWAVGIGAGGLSPSRVAPGAVTGDVDGQ